MGSGSRSHAENRYAAVNGVRLHYRETFGERGPLLCLHGITPNARAWDALAAELAPDYRVLAPDLRGRGESDKPDGSSSPNREPVQGRYTNDVTTSEVRQLGVDLAGRRP